MKIIKIISIFIICILFLTGCWDKVEIEDRAFVMTIGIDSSKELKNYVVTFQFPNIRMISTGTSGGGGGTGKPSFSISEVADTVFSASRHISTRLNKNLFLGHAKAIILGEDIVTDKNNFLEVVDTLDRSYELSRKLHILVTPGRAQDIVLKNYKFDPNLGAYIEDIFKQYNKTSKFPNIDYNKVMKSLHETNGNAIIPKIIASKDEIRISGSAIIKDYKLVGWLTDGENMGYMWLTGLVKGGDVTFNMPLNNKSVKVPFNITNVIMRRDVEEQNGKIIYKIKYDVEGDVTECSFENRAMMFDTKVLNRMESKANLQIQQMINEALNRFQKDLKVDMIGVGDYIEKHDPSLWNKVKPQWSDIFPNIEVKTMVSAHIRRIGLYK